MNNENRLLSVNKVMELTEQKRGTVEYFRKSLKARGLVKNNESLDWKAIECLKVAISYKEEKGYSWIVSVDKAITEAYDTSTGCDLQLLSDSEGELVGISASSVEFIRPRLGGSTIHFKSGKHLEVSDSVEEVFYILKNKA